MEPYHYQPKGEAASHKITAEVVDEDEHGAVFRIRSDDEEIGEVDLDLLSETAGFVSAVSPGEKINNGYLRPACFVIVSCMAERRPDFQGVYSVDDEVILNLH